MIRILNPAKGQQSCVKAATAHRMVHRGYAIFSGSDLLLIHGRKREVPGAMPVAQANRTVALDRIGGGAVWRHTKQAFQWRASFAPVLSPAVQP